MDALMNDLPRAQWVSALSLLPIEQLDKLVSALPSDWKIQAKSVPQAGLGMMKLADSALNQPFYLGEFPISSCWLQIETTEGRVAEGAAWLMDDEVNRVEQMAICDAVLSAKLPGWQQVLALIEQGQRLIEQRDRERKSILAKTRVDFSLLEDVGGQDD